MSYGSRSGTQFRTAGAGANYSGYGPTKEVLYVIDGDWVNCSWDYDPDMITRIKGGIPASARRYDPEKKIWRIALTHWDRAKRIFEDAGWDVPAHAANEKPPPSDSGTPRHRRSKVTGPWAVLCVTPDAPAAVIDAAHRAWARMYHPDTGSGDEQKMREINSAYAEIKSIRAKEAQPA